MTRTLSPFVFLTALLITACLGWSTSSAWAQDCNGNGIPDVDEYPTQLLIETFSGGIPGDWTASGLWNSSSSACQSAFCDGFPLAYFGQDVTCDFNSGAVAGTLESASIEIPTALSVRLTFCSRYEGEGGIPPGSIGQYDAAWVSIGGTIVDAISTTAPSDTWESRVVDLTAYAGSTITIAFNFNSVDSANNVGFGWAIDRVEVRASVDCDSNGVLDECQNDCDGDGTPDACEILEGSPDLDFDGIPDECAGTATALEQSFSAGPFVPSGWTATGLWTVTTSCFTGPSCDGAPVAYYGQTSTCDFQTGSSNSGVLSAPPFFLGPDNLGAQLRYCSEYAGEAGSFVASGGYDWAWVEVNGVVIDDVSFQNFVGHWENRIVDLTPFLGQVINLSFHFDSVDLAGNGTLGWQVDGIEVVYAPDCNGNGTLDDIEVASGAEQDCNGNGVLDSCDLASGFSDDCNSNGVLDDCENSTLLFSQGFEDGALPNGWTVTGDFWNVTSDCATGITCGSGGGAYFGDPSTCNFSNGFSVAGELESQPIWIPNGGFSAELRYCSAYVGENGSFPQGFGFDRAWVEVNGVVVDDVSIDGDTPAGEIRTVTLNPALSQFGGVIRVSFHFDSVDASLNSTLGWRIDDVEVYYGEDCNRNNILDECEADCNSNGVPDECDAELLYGYVESFESLGIPGGWTATGLWTTSEACALPGSCNGVRAAYYGDPTQCNFEVGTTSGDLTLLNLPLPAAGNLVVMRYCSNFAGEAGVPPTGFDSAWVEINGTIVDSISNTAIQGIWEERVVDLTPFGGQTVDIAFRFDSIDSAGNFFRGWLVDGVHFDSALDCNGNGIPDICDTSSGTSTDCDLNGVPDECDIAGGAADCNSNGIPDRCEQITTLYSEGFDGGALPMGWTADGLWNITESCDGTPGLCDDGPFAYFGDPSICSYDYGVDVFGSLVSPGIAIPADVASVFVRYCSRYQGEGGGPGSIDEASIYVNGTVVDSPSIDGGWIDSGWTTRVADLTPFIGQTVSLEFLFDTGDACCSQGYLGWQVNGIEVITSPDCNGNGLADFCDLVTGSSSDCNSNGVPDECDVAILDCNSNGIPDDCDIAGGIAQDCNGNSIPDTCDIASGVSIDCNFNSIPDDCEIAAGIAQDCNGNGIPDTCDIGSGFSQDCNINSIPDDCDIASGIVEDCNMNGVPDLCDIGAGTSTDGNLNGVPDECEAALFERADCNADGNFNIADAVFTLANLFSGGPAGTCADACDANNDGSLNIADAVFTLATLFSGGPNPSAPFGVCGTDPTADNLDCLSFPPCP